MTSFFNDLLNSIAERGRALVERGDVRAANDDPVRLAERLLSQSGEASALAIADRLLDLYDRLDGPARAAFFQALADRFGPDLAAVETAIARYAGNPSSAEAARLHAVAEPRRQDLVRKLNRTARGTERLVRMRADLLAAGGRPNAFSEVDADFEHLFRSWFNRGFLVLQPITWNTPAIILEKIIAYEAVHEICSWEDLRRRIEPADRRCYAFFHPSLNDEPLIFVEVALVRGMADAVGPILSAERKQLDAAQADTAIFYSISNCQVGLKGISFGNFLIKQVARELLKELPHLKTFATLSPIPGFRRWAESALQQEGAESLAVAAHLDLSDFAARVDAGELGGADTDEDAIAPNVRTAVSGLAAHYFLNAKHRSGQPLDPVQRFHLGNGARLDRINWRGDLSPRGCAQSFGLMVNYVYDLDRIEENHEAYAQRWEIVAAPGIRQLARQRSVQALIAA